MTASIHSGYSQLVCLSYQRASAGRLTAATPTCSDFTQQRPSKVHIFGLDHAFLDGDARLNDMRITIDRSLALSSARNHEHGNHEHAADQLADPMLWHYKMCLEHESQMVEKKCGSGDCDARFSHLQKFG
jgi:hypothetical protein